MLYLNYCTYTRLNILRHDGTCFCKNITVSYNTKLKYKPKGRLKTQKKIYN